MTLTTAQNWRICKMRHFLFSVHSTFYIVCGSMLFREGLFLGPTLVNKRLRRELSATRVVALEYIKYQQVHSDEPMSGAGYQISQL